MKTEYLLDGLAWIEFQADNTMLLLASPTPDLGLLNSIASDIAINAKMLSERLDPTPRAEAHFNEEIGRG